MRALSPEAQLALEGRSFNIRDLIWFTVRRRDNGAEVQQGYWSDLTTETLQVIDPRTQVVQSRQFDGAGDLISVSPIPLVSNLTVQNVEVKLSQIGDANHLIRTYDARQARVEIFRGLFEPGTLQQIVPAYSRFLGFVNEPELLTPREGENGSITLNLVSHTQELTRSNPATRSDAYQRLRNAVDSFRRHAAVVGTWDINWGTKN